MQYESDLEQIRQDLLSFVDLDRLSVDERTKKGLLKGLVNNLFDYLEHVERELPCNSEEELEIRV